MPNFGNDTIVGSGATASTAAIIWGSPGTVPGAPAFSGQLFSSSVYIQNTSGLFATDVHMAVYSDAANRPNVLLATTPVANIAAAYLGWLTINHTVLAPIVAGNIYWTVCSFKVGINCNLWTRAGGFRCFGIANNPPAAFPNPYPGGGTIDNWEISIYSTYTLYDGVSYVPTAACCKQNKCG